MEKSLVDNSEALKPLDLNLFRTPLECFIDQKRFIPSLSLIVSQVLTAVRREVNSLDSSVTVHELEFAKERNL